MITPSEHISKLDEQLSYLLDKPYFAPEQTIPVAVVADPEDFETLIATIEERGGTIRHVLQMVGAVAAWLPLAAVEPLSRLEIVKEIELDQQVYIA